MYSIFGEKTYPENEVYLRDTPENRMFLETRFGKGDTVMKQDKCSGYLMFDKNTSKWKVTLDFQFLYTDQPELWSIEDVMDLPIIESNIQNEENIQDNDIIDYKVTDTGVANITALLIYSEINNVEFTDTLMRFTDTNKRFDLLPEDEKQFHRDIANIFSDIIGRSKDKSYRFKYITEEDFNKIDKNPFK
jgi:hypothetical protein